MLTYFLCIAAFIFAAICSAKVKTTYAKFSKIPSRTHLQAWQVARQILDNNGLYDVSVVHISGHLTDNYNPKTKVLSLSDSVYDSSSLAAIGVAAHECGHAIQHARDYMPIKIRTAIVPLANIGSRAYFYIFLIGIVFTLDFLVNAGIILFAFVVLFQLVTLPVEFNASSRAMKTLESELILQREELPAARKTLNAAAMTYVASLTVSFTQLLRLIALANRRK
ncbi:MAG: zinc metallopeptidase [Oscillospiraceae bacterium]|nr:zinc metallopeptidase [Oscillospiraceae bacterium]